jgi:hypothetical protein
LANSFFSDDPKDKKKPKPTRIFEAPIHAPPMIDNMEREGRMRAGRRHAQRLVQEGEPSRGMPQDASRAELGAMVGPPIKEGTPLTDFGVDRAPVDMWESRGQDSSLLLPLWYAAHLWTQNQGGTMEEARGLYGVLEYMFEPPRTAEERAAYAKWAVNPTASWSEMPKGALGVELPADILATAPGIVLGLRDITKDAVNGEMSLWNVFDGLGVVLPMVGLMGTAGRVFKHADDVDRMVKEVMRTANRMEQVRLVRRVSEPGGSRNANYIFETPKGRVEVSVAEPGTHHESGIVGQDRVLRAPAGDEVASAEETVWTAIRMEGGSYTRGSEGVLGNTITQEIWRQVAEMYPEARYIGGGRVTGSAVGGPASEGGAQGTRNLWVYIGDRTDPRGQTAHRILADMAMENPEAYERAVKQLGEEGIDITPEAIRAREADFVTRGLPHELSPHNLRMHERELQRIAARGGDDWAEVEADMVDYLDAQGIKATDDYTGEPTRLAYEIIEGSKGGKDKPLSEILNPGASSEEEIGAAVKRIEDEGIDPDTGRISPTAQYRQNMEQMWAPRLQDEIERIGHTVGDVRVDFDYDGLRGYDIINMFDENGDQLLHMRMRQDPRYAAGVRIQKIDSLFGAPITEPLADRLRGIDAGLSPEVQDMTSTARRNREAAARAAQEQRERGAQGDLFAQPSGAAERVPLAGGDGVRGGDSRQPAGERPTLPGRPGRADGRCVRPAHPPGVGGSAAGGRHPRRHRGRAGRGGRWDDQLAADVR